MEKASNGAAKASLGSPEVSFVMLVTWRFQDLAAELHGHVREAAVSPHANYVVQKARWCFHDEVPKASESHRSSPS